VVSLAPAALLAATCTPIAPLGGPAPVPVARLVIVPATTTITLDGGSRTFLVQALFRDSGGDAEPPSALTWSTSVSAVTVTPAGTTATVFVPATMAPGTVVTITATTGSVTATALAVVDPGAEGGVDHVAADDSPGEPPPIYYLSAAGAAGCAGDRAGAFVTRATLGALDAGCARSEAAVFSSAGRPLLAPAFAWSSGSDLVNGVGSGKLIDIPLRLVIGVPAPDAKAAGAAASVDRLVSDDVLAMARAGLRTTLDPADSLEIPIADERLSCATIPAAGDPAAPIATRLNIYYVPAVTDAGTEVRGVWCPPNVVLVSTGFRLPHTLAHEMGHALGLIEPASGHTGLVAGFHSDNLMSSGASAGADFRTQVSVGQIYRMHRDGRSWLNRISMPGLVPAPFACVCDPYSAATCPPLGVDPGWVPPTPPPVWGSCP
jgi:hypothetical protein